MTSRNEKREEMARSVALCRATLVRNHARDEDDLMDISTALLNEALTILIDLYGGNGAADRLDAVAADLRAADLPPALGTGKAP